MFFDSDDRIFSDAKPADQSVETSSNSAVFQPFTSQFELQQALSSIAVRAIQFPHVIYNIRAQRHPEYGQMNTFVYKDAAGTSHTATLTAGYYDINTLISTLNAATWSPAPGSAPVFATATSPAFRVTMTEASGTITVPSITNDAGETIMQWIPRLLGFDVKAFIGGASPISAEHFPDVRPTTFVHFALRGASTTSFLTGSSHRPGEAPPTGQTSSYGYVGSQSRVLAAVPLQAMYGESVMWEDHTPMVFEFSNENYQICGGTCKWEICDDTGVLIPFSGRWTLLAEVTVRKA